MTTKVSSITVTSNWPDRNRKVEAFMDSLDRQFMKGELTQEDYDRKVKNLNAWAEDKFNRVSRLPYGDA